MFVKRSPNATMEKAVVDGVSLSSERQSPSLIGPNGAGKSTVMGMLSADHTGQRGLVDFEGTEITLEKPGAEQAARHLTQANNVQMKLTVRELVAFGRFPYSGGDG